MCSRSATGPSAQVASAAMPASTAGAISTTNVAPTAQASAIYITFDGFGNEDMVVILKLVNLGANGVLGGGDDTFTTKAIIVDNGDIFTNDAGNTPPASYGLTLDNNDGAVIIESNDYNGAGEHWQIQGVQIMDSTEGITGTGINLNKVTGALGGSTGFQDFEGTAGGLPDAPTNDNDVLKIESMGFVTSTNVTSDVSLNFLNVSVIDADGDATAAQSINVTVSGDATYVGTVNDEMFQGSAANETMTGGGGNDIFDFNNMTDAADHVTDFHVGNVATDPNADVLDIGDILPGATQGATNASQLSGYVQLQEVGGSTLVQVDAGGGSSFQTLVTLDGVTGLTLQQLLNNQQLIT